MSESPSQSQSSTLRQIVPVVLLLLILLAAAMMRFHNLDEQSLWYDEGVAYVHSLRSFPELVTALQDNVHVPAYFGLLGLWEDLVGSSEFGLRALSALFGLLSVAFTYALGKRLFGQVAGITAAAFVAFNTFSIYYGQETRMYAMMAAVGAASMWVYVGFMRRITRETPRGVIVRYGLALGLLNAVGMYTHYSYPLVMIPQGVMALLWLGASAYQAFKQDSGQSLMGKLIPSGRALGYYIVANLITIGLFLPWLPTALSQVTAQPNISEPISTALVLRMIQGWLAFGLTFEEHIGNLGIAVYFFLLFGLLVMPVQARQSRAWWRMLLPVVWVLSAIAIYIFLELTSRYMRFLLPVQVGLALWMARGVWVLWTLETRTRIQPLTYLPKFTAVFATCVMLVNMLGGLGHLYNNPDYQRDNYRALAAEIEAQLQPGDAIILDAPGLGEIFYYYYTGSRDIVYPLPQSADESITRDDTRAIIENHDRIFALFYGTDEQDPNAIVETTLNTEAYQISDEWRDSVRYVRYVTPADFPPPTESGAQFGESITLESYALSTDSVSPGNAIQLQLEWTTANSLDIRYKVFVQLLDANGALVAQRDSEPAGGLAQTISWPVSETITDNHALLIPDTLPPGEYTLIIGLYDANDPFSRLPVGEGDFLGLGTLRVE